jgi:hypothetical protein
MSLLLGIVYLAASCVVGMHLVRMLAIPLSRAERMLAGSAIGICVASFATYLIALLMKNLHHALIASILLMAATFFTWKTRDILKGKQIGKGTAHTHNWARPPIGDRADVTALLIITTLILEFLLFCYYEPSANGHLITARSWGDNLFHLSVASSFAQADNFPPTYPNYAGAPLTYHFMADFITAILIREGFGLQASFLLPQALFMICFFFILYTLTVRISGRTAAAFVLAIALLSTSIGIVHLVRDYAQAADAAGRAKILWHTTYGLDFSQGLLKMGMVELMASQRPLAPALALAAITAMVLLCTKTITRRASILLGALIGILPWFHVHTYLFLMLCLAIYTLTNDRAAGLTMIGMSAIISAPRIFTILNGMGGGGFLHWNVGWMVHPLTLYGLLRFWLINWGILIVLIVASWKLVRSEERWLYYASCVTILLINIVQLQPSDWDNHKLLDVAILLGLPFAGRALAAASLKKGTWLALTILLTVLLTITGAHSLIVAFNERYIIVSAQDDEVGAWLRENLPPNARVLTVADNNAVSMLAGRSIYVGYAGQLWSHGFSDYMIRLKTIEKIKRSTTAQEFCAEWTPIQLTHVVIGPRERKAGYPERALDGSWRTAQANIVGTQYTIYKPACNGAF